MQGFSHYVHSYPQQNKRGTSFNSFIGSWRDDLSSEYADQLIKFKEIFHSLIREWCMVFELWGLLPGHLSNPSDSLLKPNLLFQLGMGAIVLDSLPNVVQQVHFPFLHRFKD